MKISKQILECREKLKKKHEIRHETSDYLQINVYFKITSM